MRNKIRSQNGYSRSKQKRVSRQIEARICNVSKKLKKQGRLNPLIKSQYDIYVDGSFRKETGRTIWAFVVKINGTVVHRFVRGSIGEELDSHMAESNAVLAALVWAETHCSLPIPVFISCDSTALVSGINSGQFFRNEKHRFLADQIKAKLSLISNRTHIQLLYSPRENVQEAHNLCKSYYEKIKQGYFLKRDE